MYNYVVKKHEYNTDCTHYYFSPPWDKRKEYGLYDTVKDLEVKELMDALHQLPEIVDAKVNRGCLTLWFNPATRVVPGHQDTPIEGIIERYIFQNKKGIISV